MSKDFSYYLREFIETYLPTTRKLCSTTITTYKYAFVKLCNFFKEKKNINSDKIKLEMLSIDLIEEFISWLTNDEHNKSKSINNRLAAIKSFLYFVSNHNIQYLELYSSIKSIKSLKVIEEIIEYLSVEEMQTLFSIPDSQNKKELKHLAIITLLYESAIRVQELCDLKLKDINIAEHSTISIIDGKEGKSRTVPISKDVVKILQKYINIYEISEQDYLFKNKNNNQYTRWGINSIIQKYVTKGKLVNEKMFDIKVTPHIFRHSKAMHLLDAGVPLTTIEKLLGHASIKSTEIYAKASPKQLQQAIEENSKAINIKRKYTKNKEDSLLEWLKNSL